MIIDFHVHPVNVEELHRASPDMTTALRDVYGLRIGLQPLRVFVDQLRSFGVSKAVILGLDLSRLYGVKLPSNEELAKIISEYPDLFIGFIGLDPLKGDEALDEIEKYIDKRKFRGVKLHPSLQGFRPDDERVYPVYELLENIGAILMIHTGFSWNTRSNLGYSYPLLIEPIASKFKGLKIVLTHMGWPWIWESICLALRYENVYLDTADTFTGTPREHLRRVFVEILGVRFVEAFLRDKVLFGSNHPRMESGKIIEAIRSLPIGSESRESILGLNALRILGGGDTL
ncbi:MAG: amidohydrolase family protein [Nitrososphaerota archaeon]|nr:amidohydrolase family protein [Nitrososphaerota archaeon]